MFNQMGSPTEILSWLSQRNHHIPLEDLAYMLESKTISEYQEETKSTNFRGEYYPESAG